MDAILQNRFEGSIFFVYDRLLLQKEEDLLEDAIIYFYPHTMPIDNQCRLCGQLMGVVQFADSLLGSYPVLFRFNNEKIAVKHVGKYSFALAGSSVEPDAALLGTVDRLYFLFAFYHGSIDQVELECEYNKEKFLYEIRVIWEQYLAFIRYYGNNLPTIFNPIPYLPLNNDPNFYFSKASHILESCQRRPQVIAGAILYNRYILCSQLTNSISRCLLLLKPNQQNHPAVPIETDYQLPFGVRLFNVYLNGKELKQILEDNDNSPYQSQSSDTSSLRCCCYGHRTPRQTPRLAHRQTNTMQPHTISAKQEAIIDKNDEILTRSEKDPLSSSSNSGSKLCKAMLEDLLLKGFRCCKCIDEEDGELEDMTSFDKSIENVIEVMEDKFKPKNGFVFSTEAISHDDKQEDEFRETGMHSRNFEHSQNSFGTLEPESGIEVTGSDFHSSAATHFDQRYGSLRDTQLNYPEKSQNFQGHLETRKQCSVSHETDQVSKDQESFSEKNDTFGSQERDGSLGLGNKEKMRITNDSMSNRNVSGKSGIFDKEPRKQLSEKSFYAHDETVSDKAAEALVDKQTEQLNEKSGNMLNDLNVNSTVAIDGNLVEVANDKMHSSVNGVTEAFVEKNSMAFLLSENVHQITDAPLQQEPTERRDLSKQSIVLTSEDEQYHLSSSEDSYKTSDELLDTEQLPSDNCELNGIHYDSQEFDEINGDQRWLADDLHNTDVAFPETSSDVGHVCKSGKPSHEDGNLRSSSQVKYQESNCKSDKQTMQRGNCCEVDGLIHANLFVQAHSEIVLILLAKCDLYQNEDAVKSLWNTSLSQLGELDILMKNCAKENYQDSQVPFNLLIYDNFEKKMSGNLREPVYAQDHVFCDTAKTLHNHFNNTSQLCDVTLRNFISGIYGERTLSREAYFQETVTSSSDRNPTQNISGYLAQTMRDCIVNDHGLPYF